MLIGLNLYFIILSISSSLILVKVIKFPCRKDNLESSSLKYKDSLILGGNWSMKQKMHLLLQDFALSINGLVNIIPKSSSYSFSISYRQISPSYFSISNSIYSSEITYL